MPSAAVFIIIKTEMLYNAKRVAPYALAVLFSLNALLWWRGGPAMANGWATNSDFYIVRCLGGFVFLTTPFFTAMMMGDAVLRDFRLEVDPLLLSAPIRRIEYLLGKFLGNFLTLALCMTCFAVMLFLLQAVPVEGMIVLPWRALPYLQHFLTIVVLTHLLIAAYCFTIGTLTRNVKFVYGAIMVGYVFFGFLSYFVTRQAPGWAAWTALTGSVSKIGGWPKGEIVNQYVIVYDTDFLINRIGVVAVAALLFLLLVWRFNQTRGKQQTAVSNGQLFSLTPPTERLSQEVEFVAEVAVPFSQAAPRQPMTIPAAVISERGLRARWNQLLASVQVEFRLLRHERSLIVFAPLIVLFAYSELSSTGNSISYAVSSAQALLLLLALSLFFYGGEAMHREQELRVEAVLWSAPQPNWILLLAKFVALLGLALGLILLVLIAALFLQTYRGLRPLSLLPYVVVYGLVLLPSLLFIIGATMSLHVWLRNKYLAYIVGLGVGGASVWFWLQGYVNGLYNPVLYQLWTYYELLGSKLTYVLLHRAYWLAITLAGGALALWVYPRRDDSKRALVIAMLASLLALLCGYWLSIFDVST